MTVPRGSSPPRKVLGPRMAAQIVLSVMVLVLASASAQATSILTNGDFELASPGNSPPTGNYTTLGTGDTSMLGWKVTTGSVDWICTYWQPEHGTHSLDLSGNGAGSIAASTAMNTTPGLWYEVTFWMSGNPDNTRGVKTLEVLTDSGATGTYTYNTAAVNQGGNGNTLTNMKWQEMFWSFQATSTTTTITFESLTGTAYGPALDNVSVEVIPEPVTMAGVFLGIGGLAGYLRKRRAA